ncbi:MAG: arylsulfatase [Planctomycetaceae bacterium]|nr:arylsulfatase [Planctomycetaceae bacterium]
MNCPCSIYAFVLLALLPGLSQAKEQSRPNIVLVMTDDQGYGDLGIRGNPHLKTPNLDRFAREGVQLERFYCSPVCAPTRASLMTGRYYYRSGVIHTSRGGAKMHGDEVTIAERLKLAGYATGIFGKWHLGDTYPMRPVDQGFDEALWHKSGGIGQAPDAPNSYFNPQLWRGDRKVAGDGYCTDVFFDAALEFIGRHQKEPFFAYLPANAPHTPLEVADEYAEPYRKLGLNDTTARVYGMIANIDENFGRLLSELERTGLRENTLVLFFGDNGPQQERFNAGLRGRKSSTYEGGIRVGAFLQWPARWPKAKQIDTIAAHIDIAPTLLAAARVESPAGPVFDGLNLLPLLDGATSTWPERMLFFQCHRGLAPKPFQNCAVVTNRYKLVGFPGTFNREDLDPSGEPILELYDVPADRAESNDLSAERPEVVVSLRDAYVQWYDDVRATRQFKPGVIHIGNRAENPVRLCRYQDANYMDGVPRGWTVQVEQGGKYRLTIDRGSLEGQGSLHVVWQGEETVVSLGQGESSAMIGLTAGDGVIDIWFVPDGAERAVLSENNTAGDVDLERM